MRVRAGLSTWKYFALAIVATLASLGGVGAYLHSSAPAPANQTACNLSANVSSSGCQLTAFSNTDTAPWNTPWVNEDVNGWAPCGNMGADHYNMNTPDDHHGKITGYQLSEQDYDVYCSVGTTERQMLTGFHGGSYSAFGTSESVTANFKFYLFNGMLAEKAGSCPLSSNTYGHYEIDLGVAVWDNTAMAGLQTNSASEIRTIPTSTPPGGLPLATAESWRKPLTEGYRPTA